MVGEVVRGDRHDTNNVFQHGYVMLNLPDLEGYKPPVAWISKHCNSGSLASDFVCFVDDHQIVAEGRECIIEAGHDICTHESYLGMQDALRKLQALGGFRQQGAWAGACAFNEEGLGVVMLTLQEKWDCLKKCCRFWLDVLRQARQP